MSSEAFKTEKRIELFNNYLDELRIIAQMRLLTPEEKEERFQECFMFYSNWMDITNEQDELIGFLVVATHPNCHPDAEWYIQETYIVPDYRSKGYMSTIVSQWLAEINSPVCLFVLNKNEHALTFWKHIFRKNNYEPITLRSMGIETMHCKQYGFKPKERNEI